MILNEDVRGRIISGRSDDTVTANAAASAVGGGADVTFFVLAFGFLAAIKGSSRRVAPAAAGSI